MNTIRTIIKYAPATKTPVKGKLRLKLRRLERAEQGLCMNCGGERPCYRCSSRNTRRPKR